jgi:ribosomal protein S18 acetylase RimI-like enzyme
VVYEYLPSILTIHNLAIAPHIRRRGLGRLIVDCLRRKLSRRRRAIETFTAESNLDAQLFFRALGFQCIGIVLEKYDDGQNAYRFVWRAQA